MQIKKLRKEKQEKQNELADHQTRKTNFMQDAKRELEKLKVKSDIPKFIERNKRSQRFKRAKINRDKERM